MRSKARPDGKRHATEERILDSFEALLLENGARNLTVAAIMERAGYAKPLLYKYFGGIAGLVKAWGERRKFWPDPQPREAEHSTESPGDPRDRVKRDMLGMASHFRRHPLTLEFLAEELTGPNELSKAFGEVRDQRGEIELRTLDREHVLRRRENRRLVLILYAAIAYLGMRARRSPRYMGLRLDTDEGWEDALAMVGEIVDDAIVAARVRALVSERAPRA